MSRHHVPACRTTALSTILTFLPAAQRMISRRTFDVVHAQGLTCWTADVITAHVCNAARFARSNRQAGRQGSWLFGRVVPPLERAFYRASRARHLIAVSNRVERDIRGHYGWSGPSEVIYHGTDTQQFRRLPPPARIECRRAYGLAEDAWVWLFVGELTKGFQLAIETLPSMPDATLLVVSRTPAQPYAARARSLGVDGRVKFAGVQQDPMRAYNAADVLVHPSSYDSFGLVVAEAMACELPVVVGTEAGASEWIHDRRNGLVCADDRASVEAALRWLRDDPVRAAQVGRAARRTVESYSWDACAEATERVYARVAGGC